MADQQSICDRLHCVVGQLEPPHMQQARALLCAHGKWLDGVLWPVFRDVVTFHEPSEPLIDWGLLRARLAHPTNPFAAPPATTSDVAVLKIASALAANQLPLRELNAQHRKLVRDHLAVLLDAA